jgi:MFS family permease
MRTILVSIAALLLGVAFLLLGNGMLGTLLGLRLAMAETPTPITGLVMSAYFAGLLAGSLTVQRIIGLAGHIRAFSAFASVMSAATLIHIIATDAASWGALRLIQGYSMAGLFMCIESWLNARADNRTRGGVFSLYMIVSFLGLGVGQFLLNLADIEGKDHYLIAGLLFALCLVPVALTRCLHPQAPQGARTRLRHLLRLAPYGIGGCFAAGLVFGGFYALGAVYAINVGLDTAGVSLFMGVTIISGLLFQWPVGHLSDNHDRLAVLSLLLAAVGVVTLAMTVAGGYGLVPLLALAVLFGGLGTTLYPVSVAHVTDHVSSHQLVSTSATLLKVYGVGATLGPLGAAAVMQLVGPQGLFVFMALVCGLTAFVTTLRRRSRVPVEDQEPFVVMPRAAAGVIAKLDPRADTEAAAAAREDRPGAEDHPDSGARLNTRDGP